jgi:hypothetical protein
VIVTSSKSTLLISTLLTTLGNSHTNFGHAYPEYCDTPVESKYFPLKVELWKNRSRARLKGGSGFSTSSLLPAWDPPWKEVRGGARYIYHDLFFLCVLVEKLPVQS